MTVDLAACLTPKPHHEQQQYALRERLPMWVICRPRTSDFEGQWVARMHLTFPEPEATDLLIVAETIDAVRAQLPSGLTCIGRDAADDPVIGEVWL
jgi:hypothetical protein